MYKLWVNYPVSDAVYLYMYVDVRFPINLEFLKDPFKYFCLSMSINVMIDMCCLHIANSFPYFFRYDGVISRICL